VGFESDTCCNFIFISCKQPVVAKSVGEVELIAQNRVGDYVEWAREILIEFGYPQDTVPMIVTGRKFQYLLYKIGWINSELLIVRAFRVPAPKVDHKRE
jgi:hypothetical protein